MTTVGGSSPLNVTSGTFSVHSLVVACSVMPVTSATMMTASPGFTPIDVLPSSPYASAAGATVTVRVPIGTQSTAAVKLLYSDASPISKLAGDDASCSPLVALYSVTTASTTS